MATVINFTINRALSLFVPCCVLRQSIQVTRKCLVCAKNWLQQKKEEVIMSEGDNLIKKLFFYCAQHLPSSDIHLHLFPDTLT